MQALFTIREREEFLFQAKVLVTGLRRSTHAGPAMVLQRHRAILDRIDHDVLPRKCCSSGRRRNEPRGTLKRVPIKVRIGKLERFALAFRDDLSLRLCRDNVEKDLRQTRALR